MLDLLLGDYRYGKLETIAKELRENTSERQRLSREKGVDPGHSRIINEVGNLLRSVEKELANRRRR
jgi:hypothetical protein